MPYAVHVSDGEQRSLQQTSEGQLETAVFCPVSLTALFATSATKKTSGFKLNLSAASRSSKTLRFISRVDEKRRQLYPCVSRDRSTAAA